MAVAIILLGFTVGAIAMLISSVTLFWVGVGSILVGPLVGLALQKLGHGQRS